MAILINAYVLITIEGVAMLSYILLLLRIKATYLCVLFYIIEGKILNICLYNYK